MCFDMWNLRRGIVISRRDPRVRRILDRRRLTGLRDEKEGKKLAVQMKKRGYFSQDRALEI